ncbi:hypothetical protein [Catellatospora sp. NPDC049133]|uniref:hypothetical protein n=1 Tax=Catellatospora sp. NPDC049133 TaxID=3155499 RepID=UPI0033DE9DC0
MTFAVDMKALYEVPEMLDRLAEDARRCNDYAGQAFDFPWGPGVLNRVRGDHAQARADVASFYTAVAVRADQLARSVRESLVMYHDTDLATAAGLDAQLPAMTYDHTAGRYPALRLDVVQASQPELLEPADRLAPVPDYLPQWPHEPEWSDLVSPAGICRDLVMGANWIAVQLGVADRVYDPLDMISNYLVGNWSGMRACSDALENLRRATADLASNTQWAEIRVNACWQGNAADAAWLQLRDLGRALEIADQPLGVCRDAYRDVCEEVKELEEICELLLLDVIDAATFVALGVATAETGVGPVVFGALAIADVIQAMKRMNDLISTMQKVEVVVDRYGSDVKIAGVLPERMTERVPAVPAAAQGANR